MRLQNERGITLIELLAALTITAFVLGLIFTVIQQSTRGFSTITSRESVQEKARLINEQIVGKVREKPYKLSQANPESGTILQLLANNGDYVKYNYDSASQKLSTESKVGSGQFVTPVASNVKRARIDLAANNTKITLTLEFIVPGTDSYKYQNVIYVPSWNQ